MTPTKTPTLISGIQTEGQHQYPYVGLGLGRLEYRIYTDREGWFVNSEYSAIPPKGPSAGRIRQAIAQAGKPAFLEYLIHGGDKWRLKEKAGIKSRKWTLWL